MLFSTTAGAGHFGPMVPVARACVAAGHEVTVAAPASFTENVRDAGLTPLTFPDAPADQMAAVFEHVPSMSREEANRIVVGEVFGRLDAQAALPTLLETTADWRPHVVVRDPAEFGSAVAAVRAGIPQAQVAIGLGRMFEDFAAVLDEPLRELESLAGLSSARGSELMLTTPSVTTVPAALEGRAEDVGERRVWRYRVPARPSGPALPGAWGNASDPLIYVSFGSVAGGFGRFDEVYREVLEALAEMPVRVLLTTGPGLDPAALEPRPPNAWVENWWPQGAAMPETALVIGHGGFGTTMAAVAAGVPQVVIPLFSSDQFINAERIQEVGAGLAWSQGREDVAGLRSAVEEVLGRDRYSAAAAELAAAIADLPHVSTTVGVLEALAS